LYPGYQWTEIQYRDIDRQLTDIYKDYNESRNKRRISEADHLVNLAMSQIKQQFRDQAGASLFVPF
jgi:catalase (peroxidase I)